MAEKLDEPHTPEHKLTLTELLNGLVSVGHISREQADELLLQHQGRQIVELHPLVIIADQEWHSLKEPETLLDIEQLTSWLAKRVKLPYYKVDPLKIDVSRVTEVMSFAYASRYKLLPVKATNKEVVIATCEPFIREWEDTIKHVSRISPQRVVANPVDINRYLVEFYNLSQSIKGATDERRDGAPPVGVTNFEQLVELGKSGDLDANDQHIVNIVDWLLQYAFEQRASDIHVEPRRDNGNVRFRIDGVLHTVYEMPTSIMGAVTSRIKALGRMDVVEKRRPQDGRVKTKTPNDKEVELRLSTMPTAFGEKLVMRIFNPDVLVRGFTELGFGAKDSERWRQLVGRDHGIILVTGPTGSGKTTTLYSTLRQLARPEVNVCTIEDPIEMVEPAFNQMQVQQNINLDFASGVRTLMRQDPDIIMVGEIRDLETAEVAVQAALTGHLVLSTVHTNDSAATVARLLDLGVPAYLIKATVLGILAQRLIRTLCPHCKEEGEMERDFWNSLVGSFALEFPTKIFKPVGCLKCRNTGYLGRVGIYESLLISPSLRPLISVDVDAAKLRAQGIKEGTQLLHISGLAKVAEGITTVEEVLKVATPPESE